MTNDSERLWCVRGCPRLHRGGGDVDVCRRPAGFTPGSLLPNAPYKNPTELVVHAWRPGHWYVLERTV